MKVIPAIDIRGGRCVRLLRGKPGTETIYGNDPVQAAIAWQEQGAELIHVVDLDAAFDSGQNSRSDVKKILASVGVAVQVGGGIRSAGDFHELVEAGAQRVVFGTVAAEKPAVVREALGAVPSKVAIGVDVREGKVAVRGWERDSPHSPAEFGQRWVEEGVSTFIYTDVLRDGSLEGPNVAAVRHFAKVTRARVIAAGGIGCLEHLHELRAIEKDGIDAAIVGKALYERVFTLSEAMKAARSTE